MDFSNVVVIPFSFLLGLIGHQENDKKMKGDDDGEKVGRNGSVMASWGLKILAEWAMHPYKGTYLHGPMLEMSLTYIIYHYNLAIYFT